jgi:hypothetical protein
MAKKTKRYRKRTEDQIIGILNAVDKLPRGKQKPFLAKRGLTTAHLYYWRGKYGY